MTMKLPYEHRKQEVLAFIAQHIEEKGYPPSLREIAEHLDVSLSTLYYHIQRMQSDGTITIAPNQPRTIHITSTTLTPPKETF